MNVYNATKAKSRPFKVTGDLSRHNSNTIYVTTKLLHDQSTLNAIISAYSVLNEMSQLPHLTMNQMMKMVLLVWSLAIRGGADWYVMYYDVMVSASFQFGFRSYCFQIVVLVD